jgi:pilus assembly protein CpaE
MAVSFNLYYFSQTTGEFMQEAVQSFPQGLVAHSSLLSADLPDPAASSADVTFIEYREQVPQLDHWIEAMQQHSNPAVFLYLKEADTDTLLKALRLGVQECFVTTIPPEVFEKAVQRLLQFRNSGPSAGKSEVVALLGAKGGVGVTFMALNLAQTLVDHQREPVLLVDLDIRAGNVGSCLDINTRYTILDIIENFDGLDPQYLKGVIQQTESGLHVLPGPARLEDAELVHAHHIEKILPYIRSQNLYRWIIQDLGDILDELTLKALELSDLVLLVTLLTIPGLKAAKKILEMFHLLEFPDDRIHLVANCYNKDSDIKVAEARKFFEREFFMILRYDHNSVVRSLNEGQPLVKTLPRHRLSQEILVLANKLTPKTEDVEPHSWGIAGLKRFFRLRS